VKLTISSRAAAWTLALALGGSIGAVIPPNTAARPVDVRTLSPVSAVRNAAASVKYLVAADGNEARFRVRERLAGKDLDNDAVGVTKAVTGSIMFDDAGKVVRDSSRFTVDLTTLATDNARRDGYVRRNTLETEKFPTATFVPFQLLGLESGLPTSGSFTFQMVGELTLHGVSRLTTWSVTAQASNDTYTGAAVTQFKFADFQMTQPRVPIVLSVKDSIQLEYAFKLVKSK
jgi:polyisoprenoid-binding protein YceI